MRRSVWLLELGLGWLLARHVTRALPAAARGAIGHDEWLLDEALSETFHASGPIAPALQEPKAPSESGPLSIPRANSSISVRVRNGGSPHPEPASFPSHRTCSEETDVTVPFHLDLDSRYAQLRPWSGPVVPHWTDATAFEAGTPDGRRHVGQAACPLSPAPYPVGGEIRAAASFQFPAS